MAFVRSLRRCAQTVPDVFVTFGVEQQFRFVSHPGVMAVSKLLEMKGVVKMRATFTQENVDAMKEFDLDLARKAQIAYDNQLPVNFVQMDTIEQDLPRLLEEKKQLGTARTEVLKLATGKHDMAAKVDAAFPAPNKPLPNGYTQTGSYQLPSDTPKKVSS
eukprot:gnl/MRDRNA2_/MRDRNA2_73084_c0_seq1.p1 gnl/MRDRNA2_/MRDRNA2_73084_c0~~gnl/MRDRNA2_/MRDRNA2_73084_c0_seq1.p1  ORF type:complete len:186 (+),score=36.66 gnl/MRDRNA2_/MRDRNA2_73084_c0_seq1:81-560(+)